jgi:hypothetical protein
MKMNRLLTSLFFGLSVFLGIAMFVQFNDANNKPSPEGLELLLKAFLSIINFASAYNLLKDKP